MNRCCFVVLPALFLVLAGIARVWAGQTAQAYFSRTNGGEFGYAVAISGSRMVVGEWAEESNARGVNQPGTNTMWGSGAAYVYRREGTNWILEAYLKASNTDGGDSFGSSVAIFEDTVVVGAPLEASATSGVNGNEDDNSARGSGAAYVFVRSGTNWVQEAYLKASNPDGSPAGVGRGDYFGEAVAVGRDTIVIGAWGEASASNQINGNQSDNSAPNAGAAYVFVRENGAWRQDAYLKASAAQTQSFFGVSVAVAGETVLVGAGAEDTASETNSGAAYVFVRSQTDWIQQARLRASKPRNDGFFAWRVAMSGDTALISGVVADVGGAHVFVRTGTNWAQQAILKGSNTEPQDGFGSAVAIDGDVAVVTASAEQSNAAGINGDENNNSLDDAGAAYVFIRAGTNWTQQAYVKPWNPQNEGYFGEAAAVSRDCVAIGAEEINSLYVYSGFGRGPELTIAATANGSILRFATRKDFTYGVERSGDLSGPWASIWTNRRQEDGIVEVLDPIPLPEQAFYRVVER